MACILINHIDNHILYINCSYSFFMSTRTPRAFVFAQNAYNQENRYVNVDTWSKIVMVICNMVARCPNHNAPRIKVRPYIITMI